MVKVSWNFFRRLLRIRILFEARAVVLTRQHWNPWRWDLSPIYFVKIDSFEPSMALNSFSVLNFKHSDIRRLLSSIIIIYIHHAKSKRDIWIQKFPDDIFAFYVKESRELNYTVYDLAIDANRLVVIERWITNFQKKNPLEISKHQLLTQRAFRKSRFQAPTSPQTFHSPLSLL